MYQRKTIVALIPARGGSKRLPRKNVLELRGCPLLRWSVAAAKAAVLVDHVVVSTDDPEIAAAATEAGALVIDRPPQLATDESPSLAVFQDVLDGLPSADVLVVLQPTSPFRREGDIDAAIMLLVDQNADALVAVSKAKTGPEWLLALDKGKLQIPQENRFDQTRSQDQGEYYRINGSLYVFTAETIRTSVGYAWGKTTLPWLTVPPYDIDIDDATDFRIAQAIADEYDFNC
jgi:CMP-N,N'-diacetyllegionaminic acid synthase